MSVPFVCIDHMKWAPAIFWQTRHCTHQVARHTSFSLIGAWCTYGNVLQVLSHLWTVILGLGIGHKETWEIRQHLNCEAKHQDPDEHVYGGYSIILGLSVSHKLLVRNLSFFAMHHGLLILRASKCASTRDSKTAIIERGRCHRLSRFERESILVAAGIHSARHKIQRASPTIAPFRLNGDLVLVFKLHVMAVSLHCRNWSCEGFIPFQVVWWGGLLIHRKRLWVVHRIIQLLPHPRRHTSRPFAICGKR
mmetsp:Transcript_27726/g.48254  ORF Transcript_27726/g.48254 Transcript_27726/m.48254 type:complete len:250 (+) Transcript_27726:1320-2069(+)